jgi:protein gp37
MGENSKIEWTDHTFNIAWGCEKVSPACDKCYAESWAKRAGHSLWGKDAPRRVMSAEHWKAPLKWNAAAAKAGVVARVFCSSMADVFEDHPTIAEQRERLWPMIAATPNLQWLLLTKRPGNVAKMVPALWLSTWPENVLPGFTAENQEWFDRREGAARKLWLENAVQWFVSYEPALGPIDFRGFAPIAWIIVGGESGAGARPMMLSWVRSARDQALAAGVPFFLKQKVEGGKKISLPVLDGRQWAETPSLPVVGGA